MERLAHIGGRTKAQVIMKQQITPPHANLSQSGQKLSKRSVGLDIVRTAACLSVIASHYFLYTDFKTFEFSGISMFLQGMLASIVIGSDLYMALTGFLCCNKVLGKEFYIGGIKVLLSYIFFSIATIVVNIYIFHTGMTWSSGLLGILSFSTIPYAWYIEMWIGLFLLAPFLNIWYKSLPSRKIKLELIALLFALSAFPDFFNRYGLYLVPKFWEYIYPLAFYFSGCFIREYQPCFPKKILLSVILLITMISPIVTVISGHPTYLHIIGDRNGIFIATIAIAIFLLCYKIHIKSILIQNIFKAISLRSLDIFLCSAIFDYLLYPFFKEHFYHNQPQYGIFYFIIIPAIFIICYCIASFKRIVFDFLGRMLSRIGIHIALQSKA